MLRGYPPVVQEAMCEGHPKLVMGRQARWKGKGLPSKQAPRCGADQGLIWSEAEPGYAVQPEPGAGGGIIGDQVKTAMQTRSPHEPMVVRDAFGRAKVGWVDEQVNIGIGRIGVSRH